MGALSGSIFSLLGYLYQFEKDRQFSVFVAEVNYFLLCPAQLPTNLTSADHHVDLVCHQGEYWF